MSDEKFAYNTFQGLDEISMNCIGILMDESEIVWKLLKHKTNDAWDRPNLTKSEKRALIYNGNGDESLFNVFLDIGQNDSFTREDCIIRISPHSAVGKNRTVGLLLVSFEVFSHYKINTLSNYKTRVEMITQEFFRVFNGARVGGLGQLFFDGFRDPLDRMIQGGQLPFRGKQTFMSTNIAT